MMTKRFILSLLCSLLVHSSFGREIEDFNFDWKFALATPQTTLENIDTLDWKQVRIPHDWSVELGYSQTDTACSTGFSQGGIGWYRKEFEVSNQSSDQAVWIEFDGIYNHSTCWINGHKLGYRPNGYSSFSYDLTPHLKSDGSPNELLVRVDRSNYVDSRWYTGSGIYRNVRLVKARSTHIPQWGVQVSTPSVSNEEATIHVSTQVKAGERESKTVTLKIELVTPQGEVVGQRIQTATLEEDNRIDAEIHLRNPQLWNLSSPQLYTARVQILAENEELDLVTEKFGIRSIAYDANHGFSLNGNYVKFKGVNLHHDVGSLGAAAPKDIWYSRIQKLKDMGCNAIRASHNAHSPELIEACDEIGMLVIAEAFDEWDVPKDKSLIFLSDNQAPEEVSHSYPEFFNEWGERDLRELIRRDFNHPSIIMWSIGNEIEWTYPYYPESSSYKIGNLDSEYYNDPPNYDPELIRNRMAELLNGKEDRLALIAHKLSKWVKEEDSTRFVTCGSVHPSVAYASGYADAVDVMGFNYRAPEYDVAHEYYPETKIYGSENWGSWQEWQAVKNRDFVGGIFIWTGFAYLGEAGPWPRKGLNISLFDYTGYMTPRGHMYESMWKEEPKVFMETIPLKDSEHTYSETDGWTFKVRDYPIPQMAWLRHWEWTHSFRHWNYEAGEEVLVQAYTNCPEAELFLNGKSLGIKKLDDFDDGMLKWMVPYKVGTLEILGIKNGKQVTKYKIETAEEAYRIELIADRQTISANRKDVVQVYAQVLDQAGNPVYHKERNIQFHHQGAADRIAIDNGSEYNVQSHLDDNVESYEGRAYSVFQAEDKTGTLVVTATSGDIVSNKIEIEIQN